MHKVTLIKNPLQSNSCMLRQQQSYPIKFHVVFGLLTEKRWHFFISLRKAPHKLSQMINLWHSENTLVNIGNRVSYTKRKRNIIPAECDSFFYPFFCVVFNAKLSVVLVWRWHFFPTLVLQNHLLHYFRMAFSMVIRSGKRYVFWKT